MSLTAELAAKGEKLKRLYQAIEDGIVDLDAHLKERIETLKTERDITQASLDRIAIQAETSATITRDRLSPNYAGKTRYRRHAGTKSLPPIRDLTGRSRRRQGKNHRRQGHPRSRHRGSPKPDSTGLRKRRAGRNKTANTYVIEIPL